MLLQPKSSQMRSLMIPATIACTLASTYALARIVCPLRKKQLAGYAKEEVIRNKLLVRKDINSFAVTAAYPCRSASVWPSSLYKLRDLCQVTQGLRWSTEQADSTYLCHTTHFEWMEREAKSGEIGSPSLDLHMKRVETQESTLWQEYTQEKETPRFQFYVKMLVLLTHMANVYWKQREKYHYIDERKWEGAQTKGIHGLRLRERPFVPLCLEKRVLIIDDYGRVCTPDGIFNNPSNDYGMCYSALKSFLEDSKLVATHELTKGAWEIDLGHRFDPLDFEDFQAWWSKYEIFLHYEARKELRKCPPQTVNIPSSAL
jgi:hypothetical protein